MGKLIYDGESVYELDEACMLDKERRRQEQQQKQQKSGNESHDQNRYPKGTKK